MIGIDSEVGGVISDTMPRNTVTERRFVISASRCIIWALAFLPHSASRPFAEAWVAVALICNFQASDRDAHSGKAFCVSKKSIPYVDAPVSQILQVPSRSQTTLFDTKPTLVKGKQITHKWGHFLHLSSWAEYRRCVGLFCCNWHNLTFIYWNHNERNFIEKLGARKPVIRNW